MVPGQVASMFTAVLMLASVCTAERVSLTETLEIDQLGGECPLSQVAVSTLSGIVSNGWSTYVGSLPDNLNMPFPELEQGINPCSMFGTEAATIQLSGWDVSTIDDELTCVDGQCLESGWVTCNKGTATVELGVKFAQGLKFVSGPSGEAGSCDGAAKAARLAFELVEPVVKVKIMTAFTVNSAFVPWLTMPQIESATFSWKETRNFQCGLEACESVVEPLLDGLSNDIGDMFGTLVTDALNTFR